MSYEKIKAKYADKVKQQTSTEAEAKAKVDDLALRLRHAEQVLYEAAQARNKVINKANSDAYHEALHERNRVKREYEEAKRAYEDICVGDAVKGVCERIM